MIEDERHQHNLNKLGNTSGRILTDDTREVKWHSIQMAMIMANDHVKKKKPRFTRSATRYTSFNDGKR